VLGAIAGDIIGSPYEFDENNIKTKDFPLFSGSSTFTDDTVMTVAVAEGLMNGYGDSQKTEKEIVKSMQKFGRRYPGAGYGVMFYEWLFSDGPEPYNSFGNGAAMRVSAGAWLYEDLQMVQDYAAITARVTHDHMEGIKGAMSAASAICMAREGAGKDDIRKYITEEYGYDLSRTCDEIRPGYHHVESCQQTVPEAITAFLEGSSFEDVVRLAVSLGGDSDTLTAIAAGIAEAYYPIPEEIRRKVTAMLPDDLREVLDRFASFIVEARHL